MAPLLGQGFDFWEVRSLPLLLRWTVLEISSIKCDGFAMNIVLERGVSLQLPPILK